MSIRFIAVKCPQCEADLSILYLLRYKSDDQG